MADASQAETKFIDQMTRKLMVTLADICVTQGSLQPAHMAGAALLYIDHAKAKGWVSKDGSRVLAAGYATAAAFLKR